MEIHMVENRQKDTNASRDDKKDVVTRGPAGEFPANIFDSAKIWEKIPRAKKQKNKRITDWWGDQFWQ